MRRGDPGIEAGAGGGGKRGEAEGGLQAIGDAVADNGEGEDDGAHAEDAQRPGVALGHVGVGDGDFELVEALAQALLVRFPDRGGGAVLGHAGERILIGRGGAVLDVGMALEVADRGFAVRKRGRQGVNE